MPGNNPGPILKILAIYSPEHQEGKEGLGPDGKDINTVGLRYPGVGNFYWVVVQAVLMFDLESWAIFEAMMRAVEGTHVGFKSHIVVNRA